MSRPWQGGPDAGTGADAGGPKQARKKKRDNAKIINLCLRRMIKIYTTVFSTFFYGSLMSFINDLTGNGVVKQRHVFGSKKVSEEWRLLIFFDHGRSN